MPGGGIDVRRVPHWIDRYGNERIFLVGGSLYAQPDLARAGPGAGRSDTEGGGMSEPSKVLRFGEYRWGGVSLREYKGGGRPISSGSRARHCSASGTGEEALGFLTRYFEIQPGGYSSLERTSTRMR